MSRINWTLPELSNQLRDNINDFARRYPRFIKILLIKCIIFA